MAEAPVHSPVHISNSNCRRRAASGARAAVVVVGIVFTVNSERHVPTSTSDGYPEPPRDNEDWQNSMNTSSKGGSRCEKAMAEAPVVSPSYQ